MKILITGVAGFIGSNLADKLIAEGHEVIGIDNLGYGVREQVPSGVNFYKTDIRSNEMYPLYHGAFAVFHLAAKNALPDCQKDPVETADINVRGTANVLEAAYQGGVQKVIVAETSALYENIEKYPTLEEHIAPNGFYALSKQAGLLFAEGYKRFRNLKITALRYFNVYGPRQDYRRKLPPVMSAFIVKMLRGEQLVIYGTGKKRRDFIHVDDINAFHLLCLKHPGTDNETYNVGSGKNYSIFEIYEMIRSFLGAHAEPVYKDNWEGDAQETLADISKAKRLGWSPKVDIREGLQGMIEYIKKEMAKGNVK